MNSQDIIDKNFEELKEAKKKSQDIGSQNLDRAEIIPDEDDTPT